MLPLFIALLAACAPLAYAADGELVVAGETHLATNSGNVGIGTTSTHAGVTINMNPNFTSGLEVSPLSGGAAKIDLMTTVDPTGGTGSVGNKGWLLEVKADDHATADEQGDMCWSYWDGGAASTFRPSLCIDAPTGNVSIGIGNTDPDDPNVMLEIKDAAVFLSEFGNGDSGAAKTITWANGNKQLITLSSNCTLTLDGPDGKAANFLLRLVQNAAGSKTVTWAVHATDTAIKWSGDVEPTLSTAGGSVDIVAFYFDGDTFYGSAITDFQ